MELQHGTRQIQSRHFRQIVLLEQSPLIGGPKSQAHSRLRSTGSTSSLIGRSSRNPRQLQAIQSYRRIAPHRASVSRVDDGGDTWNCDRSFGNVSRQNNLASIV
jgi:hypothetical protein